MPRSLGDAAEKCFYPACWDNRRMIWSGQAKQRHWATGTTRVNPKAEKQGAANSIEMLGTGEWLEALVHTGMLDKASFRTWSVRPTCM